jgi:cell division protein FtsB
MNQLPDSEKKLLEEVRKLRAENQKLRKHLEKFQHILEDMEKLEDDYKALKKTNIVLKERIAGLESVISVKPKGVKEFSEMSAYEKAEKISVIFFKLSVLFFLLFSKVPALLVFLISFLFFRR